MTSPRPTPPSTAASPPTRSRLAALDGLRLLAALAVLAFHYTAINQEFWGNQANEEFPTLSIVTRYGYLGVELFFIISGFVILMTAYGRSLPSFVASRISRLFPAYWAAVLLTVALQLVWEGGRQVDAVDALMNLTMLQEAWDITNVQGAFWTLWVELKFYLFIGLLMALGGLTRERVLAVAFLWPVVAELCRATEADLLSSLLIPSWAPYFAGGMLLYLLHKEGPDLVLGLGIGLNVVLCIRQASRYSEWRAPDHSDVDISPYAVAVLVIAMFALVHLCASGPLARLDWAWLTTAGALTYPLYLVHGQFGFALIDTLSERVDSYLVVCLAAGLSLGLAWLINRFVERPLHEPMRRHLRTALERD